jgi:hypothetical protein
MSSMRKQIQKCALALWAGCIAVACGASTDDTGGESNWVRCTDDRDCSAREVCVQKRCAPEGDEGSGEPSPEPADASAMVPNGDGGRGGSGDGGRGGSGETLPDPASSAGAGSAGAEPGVGSGGAGSGGAESEPVPGGGAGGSSTVDPEPAHCAFPSSDRLSDPSGAVSDALPFADTCLQALSAPVMLELPDDQGIQLLAFAYDVNEDGVADPFYREGNADAAEPYNLWVSEIRDDELRFVHEPCALPEAATQSRRLHVRDLDADGTPDLIVEGTNWVIALRNEPAGFTTALLHTFVPSEADGWATLVDVGVADVAGDDAQDLIIGFDRTSDSVGSLIELGVRVFEGHADSAELTVSQSWVSALEPIAAPEETLYWGNFAIVGTSTKEQLWLQVQEEGGWLIEESLTSGSTLTPTMQNVYETFGSNGLGGLPLIGVLGTTSDRTGRFDLYAVTGETTMLEVGGFEPVFLPQENRELGGGAGIHQQFMIDVDGNTLTDFVEFNRTADGNAQQLAIHVGDLQVHFEPPIVLELPTRRAEYSDPFLSVGDRALGLIAYDGQRPVSADDDVTPPMVQHFACD